MSKSFDFFLFSGEACIKKKKTWREVSGSVTSPSPSVGSALFPHLTDSLSGRKTERKIEIAFDSVRKVGRARGLNYHSSL